MVPTSIYEASCYGSKAMNDQSVIEEAKQLLLLNKATWEEAQPDNNDGVSVHHHPLEELADTK
jgi:hypothetical protein